MSIIKVESTIRLDRNSCCCQQLAGVAERPWFLRQTQLKLQLVSQVQVLCSSAVTEKLLMFGMMLESVGMIAEETRNAPATQQPFQHKPATVLG